MWNEQSGMGEDSLSYEQEEDLRYLVSKKELTPEEWERLEFLLDGGQLIPRPSKTVKMDLPRTRASENLTIEDDEIKSHERYWETGSTTLKAFDVGP